MPRSMTGFARQEVQYPWGTLACEIRSVNHRYLEPSIRIAETLRSIEPSVREHLRKQLSRGKIEISLSLRSELTEEAQMGLNESLSSRIIDLAESVQSKLSKPAKIDPLDILRWPGVLTSVEIDKETLETAALELFNQTLKAMIKNRSREGAELGQLIEQRLVSIGEHLAQLKRLLPEILDQQQQKLRAKLEALAIELDEERFSQEAVYIAQKSDVSEELDRLEAHLGEVRHTLKQTTPIGRRLDFLMQELNREANTLSSKSMSTDTTQAAVSIKVYIEQMREQVQNIE